MNSTDPIPFTTPWLKVPWAQLSSRARLLAQQWQSALLSALERMDRPGLTRPEIIQMGVDGTQRVFGQARSHRQVRRMLDRIEQRAAGRREWHHLELFVEECPAAQPLRATGPASPFEALADSIAGLANPAAPTPKEEAAFLLEAWREEQGVLLRGVAPKQARAELLAFLWDRCPWLSDSRPGLQKKVLRKFVHYANSGENPIALLDGRVARAGGSRAPEIPREHSDRLSWFTAKKFGGRVQFAVDELIATGEAMGLPGDFLEFLLAHRGLNGEVNRRLLAHIKPDVDALAPYLLGKKAIDDATAPLRRLKDNLPSMHVVNADDFTMPVYCWLPDGTLTRGQVLLFIDIRSLCVVGHMLIPERNYNSLAIRSCMTGVCRQWGIPAVWYFERGIWKQSKIIKGIAPLHWSGARSAEEAAFGWEQLGSRFIHATRARSKPVEKVGDLLQRLMEGEPGYCGRDERRDCPEETKRAKLAVESGRDHPAKHFLSFEQWETRLAEIIARYNAKRQGKGADARSPLEIFEACWPRENPPTPLDARCWHLGAHYVRRFVVGDSGITFKFGKQRFAYADEQLSPWRHQEVLAWFNPDEPARIAVTQVNDRDGRTARFVERLEDVEFLAALHPDSPEAAHYREQLKKQHGFNAHPAARFRALEAKFAANFRTVITDRHTAAMAAALQDGRAAAEARQRDDATQRRQTQKRAARLGIAGVLTDGDAAAAAEGTRMMEQALKQLEEEG